MPTHQLKLRARSVEGYYQDFSFDLNTITPISDRNVDTPFLFRVDVQGINITHRLLAPGVVIQNALDLIHINKYTVSDCNIPLKNDDGYFRSDLANNFWSLHNLNPSGFMNTVQVYVEFLEGNAWIPELFFEGRITALDTPLSSQATLRCFSNTTRLTQIDLEGAGVGIEKIVQLDAPASDDNMPVVEGTYTPESGLTPLSVSRDAEAHHHRDALGIKQVINDALGLKDNTGVLTASDFKTQGGRLGDPLLLRYKTAFRYKRVRHALEKLTKIASHLTTLHSDFENIQEVDAHISVLGNIAFNTEAGRITRLPVDWIYNTATDRLYALLSNPEHHIPDQFVEYRLDTDSSHILHEFDPAIAVYRLATSDYDTFHILCGTATALDRSDEASMDTEEFAIGLDSSLPSSEIRILKYIRTADWQADFIHSDDDHRPQLGVHYHVGFTNRDYAWQGNAPSRYSTFQVEGGYLYYRYATDTAFGVARVDAEGNTKALFTAEIDGYENHLNFDFTLDADGNHVYFAWTQGTAFDSTLNIERYNGTDVETLASLKRGILDITDLETGGAFLGVHEMAFFDGFLYMVVPVTRGNREIDKSAGAVLYRYGVETRILEAIDTSDFVHFGFAGLTVHSETGDSLHEQALYYVQAPAEVYKYPAYNPDLANYDTEATENYLPDFRGNLKRVFPTGEVEDCGTIRFDDQGAFRGLLCRCLVIGDDLHLMVIQGDIDALLQNGSAVSQPSGALWCVYSRKLNFMVNEIPSTGTLDTALAQTTSLVNATLGFDRNIVTVRNRLPVGALVRGVVAENDDTLTYKHPNRSELPSMGHILINNEILSYSGRSDTQLTGLTREELQTETEPHFEEAEITFLDDVIPQSHLRGTLFWSVDSAHVYNTIKDRNRIIEIKDVLSPFAEKVLDLDIDLDSLRIPHLEFLANNYLHRFKDVRFLLNFAVIPSWRLRISEIVGFHYKPMPPIALQIMRIQYAKDATTIRGREVTPNIPGERDPITADENDTYRILDGVGDPIMVTGDADHILFVGDRLNQSIVPISFISSFEDVTFVQYQEIEPETMPEAIGGAGGFKYRMEGLPDGVFFDPKTRLRYGTPDDPQAATPATYIATDKDGVSRRMPYNITVSEISKESRRLLDGLGDPIMVTGSGDHIIFAGY